MRRLAIIAAFAATVAAAVDLPLPLRVGRAYRFDGTNHLAVGAINTPIYTISFNIKFDQDVTGDDPYRTLPYVGDFDAGEYITTGPFTSRATDETLTIFSDKDPTIKVTYIRDTLTEGWHHIACVWDGAEYDIYVDGDQKTTYAGTEGAAGLLPAPSSPEIGAASSQPRADGGHAESDVMIWDVALSSDQVRGLYEDMGGVTNWPAGTEVRYPLQSAASTNIVYWLGDTKTVYTEGQTIANSGPINDNSQSKITATAENGVIQTSRATEN